MTSQSGADLPGDALPADAMAVLTFWFLELMPENWFASSDAIDAVITDRFGALHKQASTDLLDHWGETPRGALALVIVLDQFSRNIHRGTGQAFANDEKAQSLVRQVIASGADEMLGLDERQFLYMPLMHAEALELQDLGIAKFAALAESTSTIIDYAKKHRGIIAQFGRFPYRNDMLGRETTQTESEWIADNGNPFA